VLRGCRITNAVKCVPPGNKPQPAEIRNCNGYLAAELAGLRRGAVVLALGAIAHDAVLAALGMPRGKHCFAHGAEHELPNGLRMIDSYHCSRYNTQTGRLTTEMFRRVVGRAAALARRAH
jgi:uracil-DNA glycosylase family 4